MPSTAQLKLIQDLLNLPNLKVIDYINQENVAMIVQVSASNKKATCPRCGIKSEKLHQNHTFMVRDIALGSQEVYLKINRRQFKCQKCKKPFSEHLDFLKTRRGYTKRLAEKIVKQVFKSNIRTVALQNNLTLICCCKNGKRCSRRKVRRKAEKPKKAWIR